MNRYIYPIFIRPPFDPYAWLYKYDNILADELDEGDCDRLNILFPKLMKVYIEVSNRYINTDFIKMLGSIPEEDHMAIIRKQQATDTLPLSNELKDPEARKKYE